MNFTKAHAEVFEQFTERAYHRVKGEFTVTYPARDTIWGWINATLLENADQCSGAAPKIDLTSAHADLIFNQARRGFGFSNYEQPDGRMEKDDVRSMAALLAALTGSWDLVAQALGGRPLARKVQPNRTYAWSELSGIVRHVATAARHRLGEGASAAALRAWAKHEKTGRPTLLALARLAIADAGGHPRAEVAQRLDAIIAGETPKEVRQAVSPVEDLRASVFEKYQPVFADHKVRKHLHEEILGKHAYERVFPDSFAEAWLYGIDEVAKRANDIDDSGEVWPSPGAIVVAAIGHPLDGWRDEVDASFKALDRPRQVTMAARYRKLTHIAAVALARGNTKLVKKLTPKLDSFVPGKTFGDDHRKVLRYFALALEQKKPKVKQHDVEPAFIELLVSRVPENHDDSITGGSYSWASLVCLAYAYFHLIGKEKEGDVGKLLRLTLRGQAPQAR